MSDVRACAECGRLQAYPVPVCRTCGSVRSTVCALPFAAEIYSYTIVSRAPTPALQAEVPYAAVLVRGLEGGLLLLRWRGDATPVIGAPVHVRLDGGLLVAEPVPMEDVA